ncbi:MAG: preprotein translocase subunit TatC [Candidatus Methanoperedens sp.]|nr:preprotein translocase subunit TatC [Candidatus Methanoperedens sp.]
MNFEGIFSIISQIKKNIIYLVAVFGAGALISFSYMGGVIKKIETDMFWRLNIQDRPDSAKQLLEISNEIVLISKRLADNNSVNSINSVIAQNLTRVSNDILNVSQNLNLYKPNIIYLTPMEVIMLEFKMSLIFGFLVVSPLILYYVYRGARGRLTSLPFIREKRSLIVIAITTSIALFLIGAGYAYLYMLPFFLSFLYQDAMNLGINATFSIYEFISFIVMTTVILGIAFELPVILTFLVHIGVTSRKTLAHYRRHAYVILLIIAAWVTPDPTMFTQIMVALPFIILYEASLVVMILTGK